jgi:hypothetical protein
MSVTFRYRNGYLGQVSEKVAEILESRGEGVRVSLRPGTPEYVAASKAADAAIKRDLNRRIDAMLKEGDRDE